MTVLGERFTLAVINSEANEFQRLWDAGQALLDSVFPTEADDVPILVVWTGRLLSMWETMLGLPVAPPGITLADRRAKVQAHIQARNSAAGTDWIAVLSAALGTTAWTHLEGPADYTVTITIPPGGGSYNLGQITAIARKITPAHLDVIVTSGTGFVVGVSDVGDVL